MPHQVTALNGNRWVLIMINKLLCDQQIDEGIRLAQLSIDCAADAIFWLAADAQLVYANEAACRILGYSREEFLEMTLFDIDQTLSSDRWADYWQTLQQRHSISLESRHQTCGGALLPVEMTITYLEFNGNSYGCAFVHDILERRLAQSALNESEERFRCLVEGAADAFLLHDVEGQIIDVNQWACDHLGYSRDDLLTLSISDIDVNDILPDLWQALVPGHPITVNSVHQRRNGTTFPVEMRLSAVDLAGTRLIVALGRDMSERERTREQLRQYAFYDSLTGLPNRTMLLQELEKPFQESRISGQFALLYFKLHRFEAVKYSFGHSVGEQLLLAATRRLMSCLPASSIMARTESDEFAILLKQVKDIESVLRFARHIQKKLTSPFDLNGHRIFTDTSVGIAFDTARCRDAKEMLQAADIAMHQAKISSTNRCVVFDDTMQTQAVQRLHLDADLRRALQRHEFQVHYQPILSLSNHQMVGVEALVRWQHPARGMVSPAEFIPLAEETGLIVPLGNWVLRQACQQLMDWQRQFPGHELLFVSVNLSVIQLSQPDLLRQIDEILWQTGLPACLLKLEITESAAMENAQRVIKILEQLKARQIRLSIDDFGTGYSSLSHLHSFPIDMLKVDRSFVMHIQDQSKNLEVVQTIIRLAHSLGMETIAEGIETPQQLDSLKTLGCEYGQGYLFAKPMQPEAIASLLIQAAPVTDNPSTIREGV